MQTADARAGSAAQRGQRVTRIVLAHSGTASARISSRECARSIDQAWASAANNPDRSPVESLYSDHVTLFGMDTSKHAGVGARRGRPTPGTLKI